MADGEDVRRIVLTLPGASPGESSFEVAGKGFAWFWRERAAEKKPRVERRDVLAIRVADLDEKEALLAAAPDKFFTEPHYNGYPAVLARLATLGAEELAELLTDAWRLRAPRKVVAEWEKAAAEAASSGERRAEDRGPAEGGGVAT